MATLSELRDLVRTQTETTSSELPDGTLDWYIRQAFERTVSAENDWPMYENEWSLSLLAGETAISIPVDVNEASISSLLIADEGNTRLVARLNMVDHETAENEYLYNMPVFTYPFEYSIWNRQFHLWPKVELPEDRTFVLRGYRYPTDWIALGDSSPVDADPRLHYPLVHYAIALAYAQQEATELEDVYMGRWQRDVEAARQAIMEPARQQPMSFGGGKRDFRRGVRHINVNTPTI